MIEGNEMFHIYFAKWLAWFENIRFEFINVLLGVDGNTIFYKRENGAILTVIIEVDEAG